MFSINVLDFIFSGNYINKRIKVAKYTQIYAPDTIVLEFYCNTFLSCAFNPVSFICRIMKIDGFWFFFIFF